MSDDFISMMYGRDDDDDDAPRAQPEQLRLAGKAILIPHMGKTIAVVRIEYAEMLEASLKKLNEEMDAQAARIKRLERAVQSISNIAKQRITSLESELKEVSTRRPWEF